MSPLQPTISFDMQATLSIQRVLDKLKNDPALPSFPVGVARFIELANEGDHTSPEAMKILASQPILSAMLIRQASSAALGMQKPASGVTQALMILGGRGAVSAANSIMLAVMTGGKSPAKTFQSSRFVSHSLYVSIMAKTLFATCRTRLEHNSVRTADEVFTLGVLHELPLASLAFVEPQLFDETYLEAAETKSTLNAVFEKNSGGGLQAAIQTVFDRWKMPEFFADLVWRATLPTEPESPDFAVTCLRVADRMATEDRFPLIALKNTDAELVEHALLELLSPDEWSSLKQMARSMTNEILGQLGVAA